MVILSSPVRHSNTSSNLRGLWEIPKLVVSRAEVQVTWGCLQFVAGISSGGSLVKEFALHLWGLH